LVNCSTPSGAQGHPASDFADWRRWLNAEFEAATFRDEAIVSPWRLPVCHDAAAPFEAVVLIGADATHLSARPFANRLFNQSVRRGWGFPALQKPQRRFKKI
jgi:ATP-dependent helicase/nuclease subunit B